MKNELKFSSDHYRNIDDLKKQKKANKAGDFSLLFVAFFLFFIIGLIGILLIFKINDGEIKIPFINPPVTEEGNNGVVKKFGNYTELKEFMEEGISSISYGSSSNFGGINTFEERTDSISKSSGEILTWGSAEAPSSVPVAEAGEDHSTTNIQVSGVDEGDIVKTDGKYIYTVVGNEVIIVDAYPTLDTKELSRIKLDSNPNGIYISKNKLAVYGQNYNIHVAKEYNNILPERRGSYTFLKIYDVSDKSKPILKRSFDLEGNLQNSRMIGDY
ncbi:beta-propeller domain-containing protein, partial [Candidatus Parcubacteria bacterium]|nr:beta-propeller domain-containing protein [Candidatus Parcubacteria bacterium]